MVRSCAAAPVATAALALLSACAAATGGDEAPSATARASTAASQTGPGARATASPFADIPLPAAGYLRLDAALIDPWCGAVLVAPDVAVTAAYCVLHHDAGELAVGFGPVDAAVRYRVVRVVVHPDYTPDTDGRHNLAALVLATAVTDIAPARVVRGAGQGCDLEAVTYAYVARGDAAASPLRRAVAGCAAEPDDAGAPGVRFPAGTPNCHGDSGAGVFAAEGAVLGVVSSARGYVTDPATGLRCADTLQLTSLADEGQFLAQLGVALE